MERELLFADKLEYLKGTAKDQGGMLTEAQIKDAFADFELGEDQLALVYDYLKKQRIGIGGTVDADEYLTDGEKDYVKTYLEELEGLPGLTDGEREALFYSAMAGDKDAGTRLLTAFLPQVVDMAKLYAGQGVFMEDLIGEGNVALAQGVTMLGAMENAREAEGMLGRMIMDAMEAYIAENAEEGRKDRRIADRVNKVADAAEKLSREYGRKVTAQELSEASGMTRKSIRDAMRISGDRIEDLEKEV